MKMYKKVFYFVLMVMLFTACKKDAPKATDTKADIITKENRKSPDLSKGILTEEILWHFGRLSTPSLSPDGKSLLYSITYYDYTKNRGNAEIYTLPVGGGEPTQLSQTVSSEAQPTWLPDGTGIAFLYPDANQTMQIWSCNLKGKNRQQLTHSPQDINGFCFTPDGAHLVYTRNVQLDPTITDRYPDLTKADAKIYDDLMYRHWDYWADGSYSHLFIAPIGSPDSAIDLLEGEKFHAPVPPSGGMEEVAISPDGKMLAYVCKRLKGKEFAESTNTDIYLYNLETKETRNLTADNLGYDMDPVFSPDGSKIVWWSMQTPGFESDKKRLMVHDFTTQKTTDYSQNFDNNCEQFVWSSDANTIYFLSCLQATFQICTLDLSTSEIKVLTQGDHDYNSLLLADNKLIATKTTHSLPTEIFAVDIETGSEQQLTFTNQDILKAIDMGKTEKRWVKTSDGKDMLVWVLLPPNFDPNKKYPALLYCQGGPQSPVSQFFSYRWCLKMMAAHDYIVVAPNRRGLPGFGSEWNNQISGDYGGQNMKDYLAAIDAIAQEPYVDADRLGAVGASYGGYSVYWLAGNHNKRFKAFIAHCGMFNFESWYGTTEELFFANHDIGGPYWQTPSPKSYSFSPHRFVGNWDTPILVIHGGRDFRIPYTEGMQAYDIAQIKGIPSRFLFFPDETHFVSKPQNSILWQREFFRFLDEHLKK